MSVGLRLIAIEHFEGDGRTVDRVWQTFHWLNHEGQLPDQIDWKTMEVDAAIPECIYTESGKALR